MSLGLGSSTLASCWVATNILRSAASASSRARTLDSLPTTKLVIMKGKMTTSRMGIMGRLRVSNLSLVWVTQSACQGLGPKGLGAAVFISAYHHESGPRAIRKTVEENKWL